MRSTPPGLHEYLDLLDRFLDHCRRHLQPEDWEMVTRRLRTTADGQGVQGAWTALEYVEYYWRKLPQATRQAFLRRQQPRRRRRQEVQ